MLTLIRARRPLGPGAARNAGVAELRNRAETLVFCDADDIVDSEWLHFISRALLDGSADVVGGVLSCHGLGKKSPIILAPEADYWHLQSLFGGNIGLTRSAWELLGGFDGSLRCCEDTDLAWRAAGADLRVKVVPEAVVAVSRKAIAREFAQRIRWGFWATRLLVKHELGYAHLPTYRELCAHRARRQDPSRMVTASLGQWIGMSFGRRFRRSESDSPTLAGNNRIRDEGM